MLQADISAFRAINGLAGKNSVLDAFGVFSARWLIVVMFATVAIRAILALRRPESRTAVEIIGSAEARALLAGILAFLGTWLLNQFVGRSRPFATLADVHRLIPVPLTQFAFPSGHSSAAFALAFTILLSDVRWGVVMLIGALAVAFGRVFTGVHYPLDVLAGAFAGLLFAATVHLVTVRLGINLSVWKRITFEKHLPNVISSAKRT